MATVIGRLLPWFQKKRTAVETTSGRTEATPWIVIAANLNPGEALVIKGRLESENIPVLMQQEALGSVLGLTVGPLGSAKLLVPEPLADRALTLLADTFEEEEE
jgi:hypothetical protein